MSQAEVVAAAEAGEAAAVAFCRLRAAATLQALGDLALTAGAHGGVYVAGGVGMRLARWLSEPEALARFRERGARTEYLARVPIRLIVGDGAPLIGAAHLFVDAGLGLA
jgi:glucokinase